MLATRAGELWDSDLASLNPIPQNARILDAELRGALGAPDARIMVAVTGPTADAALAAAEAVGRSLDPLVAAGTLSGYESPARYLPSLATQRARLASLPDAETLRARLALALADLPLRPAKLEPFVADVERARTQPPLMREAFAGTALDLAIDGLLFADATGRWTAMIGLRGAVGAGAGAGIDAAAVRNARIRRRRSRRDGGGPQGGTRPPVRRLSRAGDGALRWQASRSSRDSSPSRCAALAAQSASSRRWPPPSRWWLPGTRSAGRRLTIPHLIGLVLIVAIGSNYALFFDRIAFRPGPQATRTLASLGIANLTTVAGFGMLSLSAIPLLLAIGSTVALGAFLSLAFAAALAGEWRELPPGGAAA